MDVTDDMVDRAIDAWMGNAEWRTHSGARPIFRDNMRRALTAALEVAEPKAQPAWTAEKDALLRALAADRVYLGDNTLRDLGNLRRAAFPDPEPQAPEGDRP